VVEAIMMAAGRRAPRRWPRAGIAAVPVAVAAALALVLAACGAPHPSVRWHSGGSGSAPPSAAPGTPSSPPPPTCTTAGALATWSPARLAAQTVVVPVDERSVGAVTTEVAAGAGGVILFGSQAPPDLAGSLARLVASAPGGIAPFVMADEEGGGVQRLSNVVGVLPSARQMGATMSAAQIQQLGLRTGQRLRAAGVTMDLAPVLDLDGGQGPNNADAIGTRSFSTNEKTASADGLAFAAGLSAGGVVPVVKHFPGLGGATANTDVAPASTRAWSVLQGQDLLPFAAAVNTGLPAVMVSNARVPGLSTIPASVSSAVVTGVLRQRLGFAGLVLTDSLSAGALSDAGYSVVSASVQALTAGADMVLFTAAANAVSGQTGQIVDAIVAAVGSGALSRARLTDAVAHILAAKHVNLCR
jgi:beta-N-acetylhexosaminidase